MINNCGLEAGEVCTICCLGLPPPFVVLKFTGGLGYTIAVQPAGRRENAPRNGFLIMLGLVHLSSAQVGLRNTKIFIHIDIAREYF